MEERKTVTPWNPSRRATARVKDSQPAPTECRYCGGEIRIQDHMVVYGKVYGDWPWLYRCVPCDARVGMHPFTNIPLGTLANEELRRARRSVKDKFEAIFKDGHMTRTEAYTLLSKTMGIDRNQCHFGMFEIEHIGFAWAAVKEIKSNLGME
jgi:hypothetical protein